MLSKLAASDDLVVQRAHDILIYCPSAVGLPGSPGVLLTRRGAVPF